MAGCLKRMKVASLMHEALLCELGHPGLFPSKPVVMCKDWDILQECDIDTLRFCKVIRGHDARFSSFVREVTADAQNYIQDAIADARHVLHGWNHARVVLMPTQHGVCTFKKSAAEQPGADALKWSGANVGHITTSFSGLHMQWTRNAVRALRGVGMMILSQA
jgi:hypothetical protein